MMMNIAQRLRLIIPFNHPLREPMLDIIRVQMPMTRAQLKQTLKLGVIGVKVPTDFGSALRLC